jgi:hypothetical protein
MKDDNEKANYHIIESNKIDENISIQYESYDSSKKEVKVVIYIKNIPIITIPSPLFPSLENFFQDVKMPFILNEKNQNENLANTVYQKLLGKLIAWSEDNYIAKHINYNIAFPLLKELCRVGETKFQIIFQQEILKEYATNSSQVKEFLKREGYLKLIGDFF